MLRRWKTVSVIAGGMLVHITLGNVYTFGNLTPYITSYLRNIGPQHDLYYGDSVWIYSVSSISQGLSLLLGGLINNVLGVKLTTLVGSLIFSAGIGLTYFSIQYSFAGVILTYGLMTGLGMGIAYTPPLACAMKWLPGRKGLAGGLVVGGLGGGAIIFNPMQTVFINPQNRPPDTVDSGEQYFSQRDILDRVPWIFALMAGMFAAIQLVGILLISEGPNEEAETGINVGHPTAAGVNSSQSDSVSLKDHNSTEYQTEDINTLFNDDIIDMPPSRVLKTRVFYILWSCFLLNTLGVVFVSSLYKAYGQRFIKDDFFLATVGSFAAFFNCLGRMFWGSLADGFSFKTALLCLCATFSCLIFTFNVSDLGGKPLFFIYVCLLFGTFSGNFSVFSLATAKSFGLKYYTVNYGCIFTGHAISSLLGAIIASELKTQAGWFVMFSIVGSFTFVSMVLIMTY